MTTALDQYFALLSSHAKGDAELAQLGELFAPDAEFSYGGELATGEWIVPFHRHLLSRRQHSEHTSSTAVGPDGVLIADWDDMGVDRLGVDYRASGVATARLDADGRIAQLSVSFTGHTNRAWRIVRRHGEAWFEPDPSRRIAKIKAAYTNDVTFVAGSVTRGHEALSELSGQVQALQPLVIAQIGDVLLTNEYILYEWYSVTATGEVVAGWETQRVDENEHINHIVVFVNTGTVAIPEN